MKQEPVTKYFVQIRERTGIKFGSSFSKTISKAHVQQFYDLLERTPTAKEEQGNKLLI